MEDYFSIDESTLLARGGWVENFTTRPSNPPIWQTTAFDLHGLEQLEAVTSGRQKGFIYTRDGNPNQEAFAQDVAKLEKAQFGIGAASGMGALSATLLATLRPGDHVLASRVLYGRSYQLLRFLESNWQVQVSFVDGNKPEEFKKGLLPHTKLCLVESISNPLIEVSDLPAIVEAVGKIPVLVDNTFATPILFRPIEHGAKLVFHSASKYLNGHGDVMLGVVVGETPQVRQIAGLVSLWGMNSNPFECWLASRGMRSLSLRMKRVSQSAHEIAHFLRSHPKVLKVFYPGLKEHPSHALAQRLLPEGAGGMIAFEIAGGRNEVDTLFKLLHEIPFSPTLADARSTVSYPWGTSHKFLPEEERLKCGVTPGIVRLSIGLEDPADLMRELGRALEGLS